MDQAKAEQVYGGGPPALRDICANYVIQNKEKQKLDVSILPQGVLDDYPEIIRCNTKSLKEEWSLQINRQMKNDQ